MTLGKESKADRAEGCAVEEAIPSSLGFTAVFTLSQQCPVPRAAWRECDSLTARQLGFPPPEPPRVSGDTEAAQRALAVPEVLSHMWLTQS